MVNNATKSGEPLSEDQVVSTHYEKLTQLQRLAFKYWNPKLSDLAYMHCGEVQKRNTLMKLLAQLPGEDLQTLVTLQLKMIDPEDRKSSNAEFLKEVLVAKYEKKRLQREAVNAMPLYPTEAILWDKHQVQTYINILPANSFVPCCSFAICVVYVHAKHLK